MTTFTYKPIGRTFELHHYVDPYPGRSGSDRVLIECGRCAGTGVYSGHSGYTWQRGQKVAPWCFWCGGSGKREVAVSTVRKQAREQAFHAEYHGEVEAYHAAIAAEYEAKKQAEEFEAAWDEAHAEQARRSALVQGYVGEVDEKLTNLHGTVEVAKGYETHFGYRTQYGMFLIIRLHDGRVIKTSGTGLSLFGHERGDEVTILSGTVRAHESYQGQEQTVLMRTKVGKANRVG
jgi:hypothetical protein